MNTKPLIALFVFVIFISTNIHAQARVAFVAARSGLSIREKPAVNATVLGKIPYGTKVNIIEAGEEMVPIVTEGLSGYWEKVTYNNKTGYIVNSYLLPVAPPKLAVVKEMKDYFKQVYQPFGARLVVSSGEKNNIEEGGYENQKQLYKNGAEWHRFLGYEYGSDTWFLPNFSVAQGFLLLRLIPEFKTVFNETAEFPTESKTFKKGEIEFRITVEKEMLGDSPWYKKIHIEFEEGAFYTLDIFQLENDLVIFYGSGV